MICAGGEGWQTGGGEQEAPGSHHHLASSSLSVLRSRNYLILAPAPAPLFSLLWLQLQTNNATLKWENLKIVLQYKRNTKRNTGTFFLVVVEISFYSFWPMPN